MHAYKDAVEQTAPDLIYSISGKDEFDLHRFLPYTRVRHISSLESNDYVSIPFWLRQMNGFSEAITANTPDVLEQIRSYGCLSRLGVVVPYRISPGFFSIRTNQSAAAVDFESEIDICFVGRLEIVQKRAHWLPQIISGCKKAGKKFRWHIYGEGPAEEQMRYELRQRGCEAEVHFHGWLDSASLIQQLPRHDLFFLCSLWEGLPIAMVEAMLCGLACVVPAIPAGITYVLEKGGGGWTYQANSPADAIQALLRAASQPDLIPKVKAEARSIAHSLFNENKVTEQLIELERKLVALRFNGRVLEIGREKPIKPVPNAVYAKRGFKKLFRLMGFGRVKG